MTSPAPVRRRAPSLLVPALVASALALATETSAQCEVEVAEFAPADGRVGDGFGYRVDTLGDLAVVAATFDDPNGERSGSAYVFERHPTRGWVERAKLVPSDGAPLDSFSYSVAADRGAVLVGAPNHDANGADSGAVYVFRRERGPRSWREVARFTPPDAGPGATFGYSMALRGDLLLIGAPYRALGVAGRAYLYRRDRTSTTGWTLDRSFTSDNPATALEFGQDVALDRDTLAVSGSRQAGRPYSSTYVVHVHERDAGGAGAWGEVARLESPSGSFDLFGWELSLDGGTLFSAAPAEWNPRTNEIGALYVYERVAEARAWTLEDRLTFPVFGANLFTPEDVDVRGDWAVAANPGSIAFGPIFNAGSVFVYHRNVGGPDAWGRVAQVYTAEPEADVFYGTDVVLEGERVLVGAPGSYPGTPSLQGGEVYELDLSRLARATWRNDADGVNLDVHRALTRPLLGATYRAEVDLRGTGATSAVLVAYRRPAERTLPSGAVVLGRVATARFTADGPVARFAIPIPNDVALCGAELATQATLVGGGGLTLSNAQDLVLGGE